MRGGRSQANCTVQLCVAVTFNIMKCCWFTPLLASVIRLLGCGPSTVWILSASVWHRPLLASVTACWMWSFNCVDRFRKCVAPTPFGIRHRLLGSPTLCRSPSAGVWHRPFLEALAVCRCVGPSVSIRRPPFAVIGLPPSIRFCNQARRT